MSKERLLSVLDESESAKSKKNLDNAKVKKIRKDFNKLRDRFIKPKIKEIRKSLYETENKKNLCASKIKEIEKNLLELEEILSKLKKYRDYDDAEYKVIRDAGNLFNQSIDEDYYKPVRTKGVFHGNYIEHESKGDKDKNLSPKEYLNMIKQNVRDIINDHKTQEVLKVYSGNKANDYKTTLGEWKIQLTMSINFIFVKR